MNSPSRLFFSLYQGFTLLAILAYVVSCSSDPNRMRLPAVDTWGRISANKNFFSAVGERKEGKSGCTVIYDFELDKSCVIEGYASSFPPRQVGHGDRFLLSTAMGPEGPNAYSVSDFKQHTYAVDTVNRLIAPSPSGGYLVTDHSIFFSPELILFDTNFQILRRGDSIPHNPSVLNSRIVGDSLLIIWDWSRDYFNRLPTSGSSNIYFYRLPSFQFFSQFQLLIGQVRDFDCNRTGTLCVLYDGHTLGVFQTTSGAAFTLDINWPQVIYPHDDGEMVSIIFHSDTSRVTIFTYRVEDGRFPLVRTLRLDSDSLFPGSTRMSVERCFDDHGALLLGVDVYDVNSGLSRSVHSIFIPAAFPSDTTHRPIAYDGAVWPASDSGFTRFYHVTWEEEGQGRVEEMRLPHVQGPINTPLIP